MATRYAQTGASPSPAQGGTSELATTSGPVVISGATPPVDGQSLIATGASSATWAKAPLWGSTIFTTAGTHELGAGRLHRYDNTANVGITLNLPSSPNDNDEIEIKEVGNSANSVTIESSGLFLNIETPAGAIATSFNITTARAWIRWKWDATGSVYRIVGKAFI